MRGVVRQAFLNVSMGNRHDGLSSIAKKAGIDMRTLSSDSYLVFVNTARDKIAVLVGPQDEVNRQTMAYVRLTGGQKVDLRAIREIPRAFDGKAINYDHALEVALTKALNRKGSRVLEAVL